MLPVLFLVWVVTGFGLRTLTKKIPRLTPVVILFILCLGLMNALRGFGISRPFPRIRSTCAKLNSLIPGNAVLNSDWNEVLTDYFLVGNTRRIFIAYSSAEEYSEKKVLINGTTKFLPYPRYDANLKILDMLSVQKRPAYLLLTHSEHLPGAGRWTPVYVRPPYRLYRLL